MQDTATEPALLTVPETAARLRISRTLLYKLVARGDAPITPRRLGHRLLFSAAEVERYANGEGI